MHDIKELEERWKRYRRKKRMPWIIVGVLLAGGSLVAVFWGRNIVQSIAGMDAADLVASSPSSSYRSEKNISGTESYVKHGTIGELARISAQSPVSSEPEAISPLAHVPGVEAVHADRIKKRKKLVIEVVDTDNARRLHEIEKRFKLAHDPEDSLFLAKQYLHMKRYKKAEYWALQTNRINEKIEESWLIFATAKARQGKRNEALKILGAYIEKTGSMRAKELYGRINDGKALNLSF